MSDLAIYTAIFGGYDKLIEQPQLSGVDYICFTDSPEIKSEQWKIEYRTGRFPNARLSAKWFKMFPHEALDKYSLAIWIDGGIQLLDGSSFVDEMLRALDHGDGLGLFRHPVRNTVESEVIACLELAKCKGQPMVEQLAHYRKNGFLDDVGLFASGILARDNRNRKIRRLGRLWMRQNVRWSYRDQLSLPYLLWKLHINPGIAPFALWDNPLFTFHEHSSDL